MFKTSFDRNKTTGIKTHLDVNELVTCTIPHICDLVSTKHVMGVTEFCAGTYVDISIQ